MGLPSDLIALAMLRPGRLPTRPTRPHSRLTTHTSVRRAHIYMATSRDFRLAIDTVRPCPNATCRARSRLPSLLFTDWPLATECRGGWREAVNIRHSVALLGTVAGLGRFT